MFIASLLWLAVALPLSVVGFVPARPSFSRTSRIRATASEEPVDVAEKLFPDATVLEFTLEEHKPMGLTIEESLAHPMEKHIFVTKLVEDGFAKAAGLQVGDVLLSVPGIFGDATDVVGLGIEQV